MHQVITQGIGYLALLFVILSFQKGGRKQILGVMLAGLVLFVVHYSLLGAWVGAAMNLIEAAMVFVAYQGETARWAKSRFWPYFFIALFVVAGLINPDRLVNWLPVVGQIFGTIASYQTRPRRIRFIMLIPRPLWFIYNLIVGSQAGVVGEVVILASVIIGIIHFDILKQPETRPGN